MVWVGGIVLVVVAFLSVVQRSLIYHPLHPDTAACADLADSAGFEVWTNADGEAIGYRSLPGPGADRPARPDDDISGTRSRGTSPKTPLYASTDTAWTSR